LPSPTITFAVGQERVRLDQFLASRLAPEYSRSQIARMIRAGLVHVNGRLERGAYTTRAGDRVEVAPPALPEITTPPAAAPPIEVLFEDAELVVVNKPAGMAVHPAPGNPHSTLVDALLARFPELAQMAEPGGIMRPGIVHRLDKGTSGVMVVARTSFARAALSEQFKQRSVRKIYLAIVRGLVARGRFTVTRPLGRHPVERKRISVKSRHLRDAVTNVEVIARIGPGAGLSLGATLVRVRPETGRTHQIRVHLASVGHPCLGDMLYGGTRQMENAGGLERQALHAAALAFEHPRSHLRMEFVARPPADMAAFLAAHEILINDEEIRSWLRS
jgi:23S rRNA pseudouridine1911/1915/1917 synthase